MLNTPLKPARLTVRIILFLITGLASNLAAQETGPRPIRVTETVHGDGTKTVMKSDPDNHTAESLTLNQADKVLIRIVFQLDDKGDSVSGIAYSAKGAVLYKVVYKRDEYNRVCEVDAYSAADKLLSRAVYRYDAKGKVAGLDVYDANGNPISGPVSKGASRRNSTH